MASGMVARLPPAPSPPAPRAPQHLALSSSLRVPRIMRRSATPVLAPKTQSSLQAIVCFLAEDRDGRHKQDFRRNDQAGCYGGAYCNREAKTGNRNQQQPWHGGEDQQRPPDHRSVFRPPSGQGDTCPTRSSTIRASRCAAALSGTLSEDRAEQSISAETQLRFESRCQGVSRY